MNVDQFNFALEIRTTDVTDDTDFHTMTKAANH